MVEFAVPANTVCTGPAAQELVNGSMSQGCESREKPWTIHQEPAPQEIELAGTDAYGRRRRVAGPDQHQQVHQTGPAPAGGPPCLRIVSTLPRRPCSASCG